MKKKHQNIGIVVFPISEAGDAPLSNDTKASNAPISNLVDILHHFSDKLYVITGDREWVLFKKDVEMYVTEVQHKGGANLFTRVINYTYTQLRLSLKLAKLSRKVNLWIFFMGAEGLVLPMVTARLLRRQVVVVLTGFRTNVNKQENDVPLKIADLLLRINLALSNRIIAYSEMIVAERNLETHRSKISIAREHFLDFSKFKIQRPLGQRDNLVAYISRLSEGKGILNFMEALTRVLVSRTDISFLIGGDGPLRGKVNDYLDKANLRGKVNFVGWIPHDELSEYLNDIKLLVLPSYTEALPNIILEAMACGTPVLATTVGAIPDIIRDGETGFIMEDNSPDCVTRNIIRALGHLDLDKIADNAHALVEKEYSFEVAVKGMRSILTDD
ncbi:glycosyltransferase [Chloroflexota bacterium]